VGKKLLTAEQIEAKKNVDNSLITAIDGEKFEPIVEPRGVVLKVDDDCYTWSLWHSVLGERKRLLYCELPFETAADCAKHCRRILGMAWNLEVEGEDQ